MATVARWVYRTSAAVLSRMTPPVHPLTVSADGCEAVPVWQEGEVPGLQL